MYRYIFIWYRPSELIHVVGFLSVNVIYISKPLHAARDVYAHWVLEVIQVADLFMRYAHLLGVPVPNPRGDPSRRLSKWCVCLLGVLIADP